MRARSATLPPLLVLFALWTVEPASATTITVPTDHPTIQAAIGAAADGDEIVVLPGTYEENIHFLGKDIVLRSGDPMSSSVVAATVIDGGFTTSVVTFSGSESPACRLVGLTITGGGSSDGTLLPFFNSGGGGIMGHGSRATIERNVIRSNRGGIRGCNGAIRYNTIRYNAVSVDGGGLSQCHGVIEANVIVNNVAGTGGFGGGAGLADCDGIISRNLIAENRVGYTRAGMGGGLAGCDGTIRNNLIVFNEVHSGLHFGFGGAMYGCNGRIINNTVYGNSADHVGGLDQCTGTIVNCIIWENFPEQIAGSTSPLYCCIQGWTGGGIGNIALDPLFVDTAGGEFHLRADSPCIDAGGFVAGLSNDIEGDPRPFDAVVEPRGDGSDFDIGMDEYFRAPMIVTVPTDHPTIQAAIDAAIEGDEIVVLPGTYQENIRFWGKDITLRSTDPTDPTVVAATVIDGLSGRPFPAAVTFSGRESGRCILSGFTIRKGHGGIQGNHTRATIEYNTISENSASTAGAGLLHCHGFIRHNVISRNRAGGTLSGRGGGLYQCHGVIEHNRISENAAGDAVIGGSGAGLFDCDGIIRSNTITSNLAVGGWTAGGGGLSGCDGVIENNLIVGNTAVARYKGGGVAWGGGLVGCSGVIRNNTISGNSVQYDLSHGSGAGGLSGCRGEIVNCIIWGNVSAWFGPSFSYQIGDSTTPTYSCIQNWTRGGNENISLDPRFVDPANGDFHLLPDSPCIDAGAFIADLVVDIDGDPRPLDKVAEPRGDGSDFDIGADEYGPLGARPNLRIATADFAPEAPAIVQPGDPLALGAFLENAGEAPAGPFWLEFWGSRTGGLTLDTFLGDSRWYPGLAGGGSISFAEPVPLYSVPDGAYTVVFAVDRPGAVPESNERDNRAVVAGKRILVFRPSSHADLVVEGFTFGPNPVHNGEALALGGFVRNTGSAPTGPFWIEFWGSYDRAYPDLHFFLCDSMHVADLAPGEAVDLSRYPRTLYNCPAGVFMAGVFAGRSAGVNERDETNNHAFIDGIAFNQAAPVERAQADGPDLVVAGAEFAPWSPARLAAGSPLSVTARIENRGSEAAGRFWVEFWGADHGGLLPREFLVDSAVIAGLPAGGAVDLAFDRPLYSIPGGPYTVDVWVDRPHDVAETNKGNNLFAVPGKKLLVRQPQTQANIVIEGFDVEPDPMPTGRAIALSGTVRNAGTEPTGPFWIEFWGSSGQDYPGLGFMLCDSIHVPGLAAGGSLDLAAYPRILYSNVPPGPCAIVAFADRTDLVNETDEADNYAILRDRTIAPDEITIVLPGDVPLVMLRVPAGSFRMGSPDSERSRDRDEGPVHTVNIAYDFYLGKYELTQQQWLAVMGGWPDSTDNPPNHPEYGVGDNYPAYFVSWNDAQDFIATLNTHVTNTGQGPATFRLPSEAEWEYACRAGTSTRFFFGDSLAVDDLDMDGPAGTLPGNRSDYMWWRFNCSGGTNGALGSKPVGTKRPNPFGLYDMSGNLHEYCQDTYQAGYTGAPADGSAWEIWNNFKRVIRGGSWGITAENCRSAARSDESSIPMSLIGFRVAWTR